MTEKPKCLIKDLSTVDSIYLAIRALFTYTIFIFLFSVLLYFSNKMCFIIKINVELLFTLNPSFKFCVYVSTYALCFIIILLLSITVLSFALRRTILIAKGQIYKLYFVDENNNVLFVKYESLSYLKDHGYSILTNNTSQKEE